MTETPEQVFRRESARLEPTSARFAIEAVDLLLRIARSANVSDIHLQPEREGLSVAWRIDGLLRTVETLPASLAPNIVARLKVLADLLTYQTDFPQEGRIRSSHGSSETRVCTFPTLHGERAVVRIFAEGNRFLRLGDLGYPADVVQTLESLLGESSGLLVLSGPAGSGKTTTLYACLRELVHSSHGRKCIATLEDPVEVAIAGVVQSQVNPSIGLTLEFGLKSLLRQDPEIIAVGEIRDPSTAEVAFQAALTGHLVLTTFHAGSAAETIGRLSDMGIEPYVLKSGLRAILSQRLVRKLCPDCSRPASPDERLGLPTSSARVPTGCPTCAGSGYSGRIPLAEALLPRESGVGRQVLRRSDVHDLQQEAIKAGMVPLRDRARTALDSGDTSPAEVRRIIGTSNPWSLS